MTHQNSLEYLQNSNPPIPLWSLGHSHNSNIASFYQSYGHNPDILKSRSSLFSYQNPHEKLRNDSQLSQKLTSTPESSNTMAYTSIPMQTSVNHNIMPQLGCNNVQYCLIENNLLSEMHNLHLCYIEAEDSPRKMEQREKLEYIIIQYLSVSTHNQKFLFPEVLEVLERSVMADIDFCPHKAANAFDALAQFAANLICEPWRKEYKEIKLYSGFWIHQVSSNISGAECILELMGYSPTRIQLSKSGSKRSRSDLKRSYGDSKISQDVFQYSLHGLIDPDLIERLALDCLIAYCECQILKKLKEGLKDYDMSWVPILNFRQMYVGTIETSLRSLNFMLKQIAYQEPLEKENHFQESTKLASENFRQNHIPSLAESCTARSSRSKSDKNPHEKIVTAKLIDLDSQVDNAHPPKKSANHRRLLPKILPKLGGKKVGSNSPNPGLSATDVHAGPILNLPRLPDLSLPKSLTSNTEALVEGTHDDHVDASLQLLSSRNPRGHHVRSSPRESWEFVYKGLEEKGYNKDLGERENILFNCKKNNNGSFINCDCASKKCSGLPKSSRNPYIPICSKNLTTKQGSIIEALAKIGLASDVERNSERIRDNRSSDSLYDNLSEVESFETPPNVAYNDKNSYSDNIKTHRIRKKDLLPGSGKLNDLYDYDVSRSIDIEPESSIRLSKNSFSTKPHRISDNMHDSGRISKEYKMSQKSSETESFGSVKTAQKSPKIESREKSLTGWINGRYSGNESNRKSPFGNETSLNNQKYEASGKILRNEAISKSQSDNNENNSSEVSKVAQSWSCAACTYLNTSEVRICGMCGKSKTPGPEIKPLEFGGKQCSLCTLINDKSASECSACGGTLQGASTYI